MKKININQCNKWLLMTTLIAFLVTTFSSVSLAQVKTKSDLKPFEVTIERTQKGIKLHSDSGSAWIDLDFVLANDKPQAIDEHGMAQLGKVTTIKDPNLADYLFTITKTKDGITLTGIEGTAWKELKFSLKKNKKQSFNQLGMVD